MVENNPLNVIDKLGLCGGCQASRSEIYDMILKGGELALEEAKREKRETDTKAHEEAVRKKALVMPAGVPLNEWGGKVCCSGKKLYLSKLVSDGLENHVRVEKAKCEIGDSTVGLFHNHTNGSELSDDDKRIATRGKPTRWDKQRKPIYEPSNSIPPQTPIGRTIDKGNGYDTDIFDPTIKPLDRNFAWPIGS
jgi:hypothetical protein